MLSQPIVLKNQKDGRRDAGCRLPGTKNAIIIDDASITALVKSTLLLHRSASALNTTVETKEGLVGLGGKARSAAEKKLASKLVSDVYGVKTVVNTMVVQWTECGTNSDCRHAAGHNQKGGIP